MIFWKKSIKGGGGVGIEEVLVQVSQVERKGVETGEQKLFFFAHTERDFLNSRPLKFSIKGDCCLVDWPVSFGRKLSLSSLTT